MYEFLMITFLIVALALIGLVLIQQGKGADMGASFGSGASNTVFGSSGSGNFLTRSTAVLAVLFFVLSLVLGNMATSHDSDMTDFSDLSAPAQQQSEQPAAEQQPAEQMPPAGEAEQPQPQGDVPPAE
ncbi:preprotein translocase subunit SecG [Idiomarina tyrosinivorans]|uniref:Protein-export membrane protein SecG n=1 Tax=Idiomarina tyrosinivorans TaxID=1445662 RepID=A0A432ZRC8_9GAMM|nr:preprotein translocase subunit SecG [Idiomarina tyrosinivorans]RUO80433.1 preprotein translocase subunit SecG [Idiomarina tyrosinivorans]